MLRGISITLLFTMGLIANQLPILWTSYQTYNQRFAAFYCVNPGTSCHGSCTMKRQFIERSAPTGTAQIPASVLLEAQDLSPITLLNPIALSVSMDRDLQRIPQTAIPLVARSQRPPTPPPRG